MTSMGDFVEQDEQPQNRIDPLNCMGEIAEGFFRALTFARAALVQLQQKYRELQQEKEALRAELDTAKRHILELEAAGLSANTPTPLDAMGGWESRLPKGFLKPEPAVMRYQIDQPDIEDIATGAAG